MLVPRGFPPIRRVFRVRSAQSSFANRRTSAGDLPARTRSHIFRMRSNRSGSLTMVLVARSFRYPMGGGAGKPALVEFRAVAALHVVGEVIDVLLRHAELELHPELVVARFVKTFSLVSISLSFPSSIAQMSAAPSIGFRASRSSFQQRMPSAFALRHGPHHLAKHWSARAPLRTGTP